MKASQRAAKKRYTQKYTRRIIIELYTRTDTDIIEKLESVPYMATYIKQLIRKDIAQE